MEHPYGKGLYTPANGRSVYGAGCAKFGNSTQIICMEQKEYYLFYRRLKWTENHFYCQTACHRVGDIVAAYSTLQCSVVQ
jgi:hypothetical protein